MLGRLGLDLARGAEVGKQREVDEHDVLTSLLEPELPDRLEEGLPLDITDRSAELADDDIGLAVIHIPNTSLDLIGDMGNHLHRRSEIVSAPLLGNHLVVDLARGVVGVPSQLGPGKTLIVAEVQVRLGPIICNVDLTVLVRTHGSGVDVEIGIQLLEGDREAMALQKETDGGRGKPLTQRGDHPSSNKYILGH